MTARNWLVAGLLLPSTALAQDAPATPVQQPPAAVQEVAGNAAVEDVPRPEPAKSRVASVTVYQGNALVTREVTVPQGRGLVEVVVTPLPAQVLPSSLYTEGSDGLRVLST